MSTPEPASREETPEAESAEEFAETIEATVDGAFGREAASLLSWFNTTELKALVAAIKARDAIRDAAAEERGRLGGLEQAAMVADDCAAERLGNLPTCRAAGGNYDALAGKWSEAVRIAESIRSLGAGGSR